MAQFEFIDEQPPCFSSVHKVLAREMMTLMNEVREGGKYTTQPDASALPRGVYFYRLAAGEYVQTRKIVLIQ